MKTVLASLTWALALVAGLASGAVAQGLQTGVITGTITSNDGLSMPGRDDHRRIAGAPGHAVGGHRRQRHLRRPRPAAGRVRRHHRDGRHGDRQAADARPARAAPSKLDVTMAPAAVAEQVTVRAEAAPVVTNPTIGANFNNDADRPAADRPHAVQHRRARARPHRQRPERRPGDDRGRVRLRQRVPDQRRRRQRQPLRHQPTTCSSRTPSRRRRCSPRASRPSTAASRAASSTSSPSAAATSSRAAYRHNLSNASWTDETPFETPRAARPLLEHPRGHVRRAGAPRPRLVLQRRPLRELDRRADVPADRHRLRLRRRQQALRAEGHR